MKIKKIVSAYKCENTDHFLLGSIFDSMNEVLELCSGTDVWICEIEFNSDDFRKLTEEEKNKMIEIKKLNLQRQMDKIK